LCLTWANDEDIIFCLYKKSTRQNNLYWNHAFRSCRIPGNPPVESLIRIIRGHKVMLDTDLAGLYEVETRTLNHAVRRNLDRFPEDFMFQLSVDEAESLEITNCDL